MCGIAGYIRKKEDRYSAKCIDALLDPIRARGPDDEGVCLISRQKNIFQAYKTDKTVSPLNTKLTHIYDKGSNISHEIAFIHTRYSIIDLSAGGHQPFLSQDGNIIVTFNGEIYNYIELREELLALGVKFRTSSDTEVLVEGYCVWREKLWTKLNGFWAIALYDFKNDIVIFSRDRIGVAPFYYRQMPDGFYFASAIKSLIDIAPQGITWDEDVLWGFIQTGIKDHDSTTYYAQIKSIPSKTTVTLRRGEETFTEQLRYWDFPQERLTTRDISMEEAVKKYREIFFSAVEIRLRSDVKVAFELSGGLDSSSIVAVAALLRKNNITTYTAKVKGADEEPYARSMLKKYLVDYHVIKYIEADFIHDYEKFACMMEEPYDNPNAYTHHRMLQMMKADGVDVVVTGAGGDEVLAGYEASFWPKAYLQLKSAGFGSYLYADWYEFCRRFKTLKMTAKTLRHYFFDSFKGLAGVRGEGLSQKNRILDRSTSAAVYHKEYQDMTFHERALHHFNVALVPFYMRSSDHFTMGIPIEHRFPFLDYRMVELGMQLPPEYLFRSGWTKYILRKTMEPYLPHKILWRRKKMGFTFPYGSYLRAHQNTFQPLLAELNEIKFPIDTFGSYEELAQNNPVLLWRIISTAIWVKYRH